jgi:hypothetical protein
MVYPVILDSPAVQSVALALGATAGRFAAALTDVPIM